MKASYLRDKLEPRRVVIDEHRDELVEKSDGMWYWPAGTIEEHPRAYMLVRMGDAEPADDECVLAAAMSSNQQAAAKRAAEALAHGIHPEDYQRFFDGEITGYDADGNDIPGPNWIEPEDIGGFEE